MQIANDRFDCIPLDPQRVQHGKPKRDPLSLHPSSRPLRGGGPAALLGFSALAFPTHGATVLSLSESTKKRPPEGCEP